MNKGKIFLVPTPIGNLKDITIRALDVLKEADIIAAEDTRQTIKLLNHYQIKKPLVSYHMHNEQGKSEELLEYARNGKVIAVVTDAGTPGISDPGAVVVKKCIDEEIEFVVLPGATAFTTGLVYSGLDTTKFVFRGFISRDTKERKELIEQIKSLRETIILYESPYRLINTLKLISTELGDRNIAVCRELTKMHEEIVRGKISEVVEKFEDRTIKGEIVIVIEGKQEEDFELEKKQLWEDISVEEHIKKIMEDGISKKEAIKKVAKDRGLPKNEVYKYSTNIEKN